jgi:hypothetical protein
MAGMRSLITVLLYLNDGGPEGGDDCHTSVNGRADKSIAAAENAFTGGETAFSDPTDPFAPPASLVVPRCGRVVLFEHALWHSGRPLNPMTAPSTAEPPLGHGYKYVMRTDVMFQVLEVPSEKSSPQPVEVAPHAEARAGKVRNSRGCGFTLAGSSVGELAAAILEGRGGGAVSRALAAAGLFESGASVLEALGRPAAEGMLGELLADDNEELSVQGGEGFASKASAQLQLTRLLDVAFGPETFEKPPDLASLLEQEVEAAAVDEGSDDESAAMAAALAGAFNSSSDDERE